MIDKDTAKRIGRAVRQFEGQPFGRTKYRARHRSRGGLTFSGDAYAPNGVLTEDLTTYSDRLYIKFDRNTYMFTEEIGPMPSPWAPNEVWWSKEGTAGDIVLTQ